MSAFADRCSNGWDGTSYVSHFRDADQDLNEGASGDYIYLDIHGTSHSWGTGDKYPPFITDVVMLNTGNDGNYPDHVEIEKGGVKRTYYPVLSDEPDSRTYHDLNCGAGGPYLWMYYTNDHRDGYVLSNYKKGDDSRGTFVINDMMYTETDYAQYMRAYKKNDQGQWIETGIADMNEGVKGKRIYFFMVFNKFGN